MCRGLRAAGMLRDAALQRSPGAAFSTRLATLLLAPGHEFLEQGVVLGGGRGRSSRRSLGHRGDLFLRHPVASPPRHASRQVYVLPLGMKRRLFELVEPFEIVLDETLYPLETIALLPPIVDGKNGQHAQGLDVLAGLDEIGIVLVRQRAREIIIGKLVAEFDGDEMKARFGLELDKQVVRLPAGMDDGVYLA